MPTANPKIEPAEARAERFCQEYLKDHNGTQAAIRAGYSARSASVQASRLLTNAKVKQCLAELEEELKERSMLSAELVREECRRIVAFSVKQLFREDGSPIPIHELPDEVAACISSIEYETRPDRPLAGSDDVAVFLPIYLTKLRFWPKVSALDSAARMMGMFKDSLELKGNPIRELMERLDGHGSGLPAKP
jgi:phage terminase small subunit